MIRVDGQPDFTLHVETTSEYGKYLVTERADAFLVGVLPYAMRTGHDITCEDPVTSELAFMLKTQLIPTLVKHDDRFNSVKIICPLEDDPIPNEGAVGTGNSLGTDSFCTIAQTWKAESKSMRLTHLVTINHGVAGGWYQRNNWMYCAGKLYEKEKKVAEELGLPQIYLQTNYPRFMTLNSIPMFTFLYQTYWLAMLIMSMAKLFGTYFYSSSGADYSEFSVEKTRDQDCATYDLLTLSCVSIRNGIRFISGGGEKDRGEKLQTIAEFPIGRKNLQSCLFQHYNCMVCGKCERNLLYMDALGLLDKFTESYDIPYYRAHRNEYIKRMCASVHEGFHGGLLKGAYDIIKKREPALIARFEKPYNVVLRERNDMENQRTWYQRYTTIFRRALLDDHFEDKLKAWFDSKGIHTIVIYGWESSSSTMYLAPACEKFGVKIASVVENSRRGVVFKYPHLDESTINYPECDAVIICALERPEMIRKKLSYFVKVPVYTFEEVMDLR